MLKIENLFCGYEDKLILKNINLQVSAGEIVCILGTNGCGKTTLLRAISKLIPFEGNIILNELNIHHASRKEIAKNIALMTQMNPGAFAYTVQQTVMMGRYIHQKQGLFDTQSAQDIAFVQQCMQQTGIYDLKDTLITQLSGGQLQRVFLACVFAQNPNIILLDEPTNHLDFKFQLELTKLTKEWVSQNKRCVIAVLHDINLALNFADRIILLDQGEIVANQPVSKFNPKLINQIYQADISNFMLNSLKKWEDR